MKLNTIDKLLKVFNEKDNEVFLPDDVIRDAKKSLSRMVSFKEKNIINKAS